MNRSHPSDAASAAARVLRHVQEQLAIHAGETIHLVLITPTGPSTYTLIADAPNASPQAATGQCAAEGCAGDVLKVLRTHAKRLTVQRLLEVMRERARVDGDVQAWSETKVSHTATAMVQLGYLTSSKVTDPPGYGLPEWGDGPGPGPALSMPTPSRNGMAHAERNGEEDELDER